MTSELTLTKAQLNEIANSPSFATAQTTAPARVRRYLAGGKGLLPHSCTLFVYRSLPDALAFTVRALKTGSGVKCVFGKDFVLPVPDATVGKIEVRLSSAHVDLAEFSKLQTQDYGPDYCEFPEPSYSLVVQDSMETELGLAGDFGIIESWRRAYNLAMDGINVLVDLSNLRPAGSSKSDGYNVTSSGPASFAKIYIAINEYVQQPTMLNLLKLQGTLNEVVLKGGHKRGIVTSMMDTQCSHIDEYLDASTSELEGSHKKGIIIGKDLATGKSKAAKALRGKIVQAVNSESIFLQKDSSELGSQYSGTYSNVCVGIFLPDRGTCLIWRVNLGQVTSSEQLTAAFVEATRQNIALHYEWHMSCPSHLRSMWKPIAEDRQVAVDVVGLANMLSNLEVSYADFVRDLETKTGYYKWFAEAYRESTLAASECAVAYSLPDFDRLHTVEPAQSHAFELEDTSGSTLARGIWPPFDTVVNRVSDNEQSVTVDHGDVETLADVGPELIHRLNCAWQQLMADNGKPHAISADSYSTMTESSLLDWWQSPLLTQYYQFAGVADQSYARKQVEEIDLEDEFAADAASDSEDFNDSFLSSFGEAAKSGPRDKSGDKSCPIDPTQRSECSVCAE